MMTTTRPQQRYDHRLPDLVRRTATSPSHESRRPSLDRALIVTNAWHQRRAGTLADDIRAYLRVRCMPMLGACLGTLRLSAS
jgi:hypothetical protein